MIDTTPKSGYAPVNGLQLYYETYGTGTGEPVVLLHGGFGTTGMFAALTPALAENRPVIAVELQGHGHTADTDRPLAFEAMADDIAALLQYLKIEHADLFGYSLGGGVAWQTAIRHPEMVRRLVIASAPCKRQGWYPESVAGMAAVNGELASTWVGTPMHAAYAGVAPNPENWPRLADKLGGLLRQEYDWSAQVARMKAPVLLIVADADAVRLTHAVEIFELLGGGKDSAGMSRTTDSQLAVVPAATHMDILFHAGVLLPSILPFLGAPAPEGK